MEDFEWLNCYDILFACELTHEKFINNKGSCRFCKKSEPQTSFTKLSHVVPEFLGNKYLFSLDECDTCNQEFGNTIETDLANFIGIHRTLTALHGKNGVPKKHFQKEKEKIYVGKNKILEVVAHKDSPVIKLDKKNKSIRIDSLKSPYYPFGVYKALNKIALSLIPESYLDEFSLLLNWINDKHNSPIFITPAIMQAFYTFIPGFTPFPAINILLIKRKDHVFNMPYMIFRICFKNFIYQIPLIRNKNDLPHIGEMHEKVSMHLIPNYHDFCERKVLFGSSQSKVLDLSKSEKIKSEKESFEFSFQDMLPLVKDGMTISHSGEAIYDKLAIEANDES
ncbi:HNH endonuclease [Enterobacter hormaechei]